MGLDMYLALYMVELSEPTKVFYIKFLWLKRKIYPLYFIKFHINLLTLFSFISVI